MIMGCQLAVVTPSAIDVNDHNEARQLGATATVVPGTDRWRALR
jgi:hypothetical protein